MYVDADVVQGLRQGRYARLWVSDASCGIDAETRARVFEPFFSTKPVDQGTGLGFAVTHGIVTTHHGVIALDSTPGKGSRFDVYLPLAQPPADAVTPVTATQKPISNEDFQGLSQMKDLRVVCIDDDETMLLVLEAILQRTSMAVTAFQRPQEAVAALRAQPLNFDLVVTDFNMPDLSGLDLAEEVARIRPDLPIVIISGYVTDELRDRAAQLGMRAVLNKENTFDDLATLMNELMLAARGTQ